MELEIWSDIACPWCYIGKRRFEAALARFEHAEELNVTWRSFELDPSGPAEHGLGDAMKERLLRAYFTEGRLISDPDTLIVTGVEVGVPETEIRELLAGDRFAEEVRADEQLAAGLGISGVPTFIVDRRVGVTGAQPEELLLEMLNRSWAERSTPVAG